MLGQLWKTIRTALLVIGVLLCFFAFIELARAYEVLRDLHPALGLIFVLSLLAGITWLIVAYVISVTRRPPVLIPPGRAEGQAASLPERRAYHRYLVRVMKRLSVNEELPVDRRQKLMQGIDPFRSIARESTDADALGRAAARAESEVIQPAVDCLNELADKEVRKCVRDVMLGVTLSPWRSVDLLVVLYRNVGMVLRVVAIYEARPRFREQMLVLRDVLAVVATVNYLNYGSRLSRNLLASVPGLGRFTDDVAQGVGAGLLTSVAGHSAVDRCRAFRGWDREEAQRTVIGTLQVFMADIKGIMLDQIVPLLNLEFVDRMRQGIAAAIDETAKATDLIIRRPVVAAGRGVVGTGVVVRTALLKGSASAWRGISSGGKRAGRLIGRASVAGGRGAWKVTAAGTRLAGKSLGVAFRGGGAGIRKIDAAVRTSREKKGNRESVEQRDVSSGE